MTFIDSRSYRDNYEMWKHQGKSYKWLKGYEAAWNGRNLPPNATDEYKQGYEFGAKDRLKENLPPHIRDGFSFGHGYKADSPD